MPSNKRLTISLIMTNSFTGGFLTPEEQEKFNAPAQPVETEQPQVQEEKEEEKSYLISKDSGISQFINKAGELLQGASDAVQNAQYNGGLGEGNTDIDEALQDVQEQDGVIYEAGRAVLGSPANLSEKLAGGVSFAGDVVGGIADAAGIVERDETDIPWNTNYEYLDLDLTGAETKTVAGGIVQEALSFMLGGGAVGGAAGALGLGAKGQAVAGLGGDFILDYFSSSDGGNLSNLIQSGPLANPLSEALAHQDDDNEHLRRLKNSIEGLIPGLGVEAVMHWVRGLRAGKAVITDGGTPQQAKAAYDAEIAKGPQGPNVEAALKENQANSAKPGEPGFYEPNERAARKADTDDINDIAISQGERTPAIDGGTVGDGKQAIQSSELIKYQGVEELAQVIAEKKRFVDIKRISESLRLQPKEYVQDTFKAVADYALGADVHDAFDSLRFTNTQNVKGVDAGGAVVLRVLMEDITTQMARTAENITELDFKNIDSRTQVLELLEEAKAFATIKKEATMFSSYNLSNWKEVPLELVESVKKANKEMSAKFDQWTDIFRNGTPEEIAAAAPEFKKFVNTLVVTKGDPTSTGQVLGGAFKYGFQALESANVLSLLTSPLTHIRNISGTAYAVLERPFAESLGYAVQGKWKESRQALSAFDSIHVSALDALRVGRMSIGAEASLVSAGSKMDLPAHRNRQALENIIRTTSGKEKWMAERMLSLHNMFNSPWFTWSGKALQVEDDAFKTLLANMDIRRQAAIEADRIAFEKGGTADKGEIFTRLRNEKLSPSGQILDHELIRAAEEATFQTELKGMMKAYSDGLDQMPGSRMLIPFRRGPHNLNVFALNHTPVVTRLTSEWKHVMKHGTEQQKAIMRGNAAIGYAYVSGAIGLTAAGILTGSGPAPGTKERTAWERKNKPHSIKVYDKDGKSTWVSYKGLPGVEVVFSVMADAFDLAAELPDTTAGEIFAAATYFITNAITDRSFFQGMVNASAVLDSRNWTLRGIQGGVGGFLNNTIGNAGLRRQIEKGLGDNMTEYRNWLTATIDVVTAGVPGFITEQLTGESATKVDRIDVLTGQPMKRGTEHWLNSINPFTVTQRDASPLVRSLAEIDYPINEALVNRLDGVQLNGEERNVVATGMYAGGEFAEQLQIKLGSKPWQDLYKDWEKRRLAGEAEPKKDALWYKELNSLVARYRKKGLDALRNGSGDIEERFRERAASANIGAGQGSANSKLDAVNELLQF